MARKSKMIDSAELPVGQRPDLVMPDLGAQLNRGDEVITPVDKPLMKDTLDSLAFAEEWMTILLTPFASENPPDWQFCAVQGKGAEILVGNRVVSMMYLPMNTPLVIKRKYVEAMLLSRSTTVKNVIDMHEGQDRNPTNTIRRLTTPMVNVQIREDKSPYGTEWLLRTMALAA